MSAASFEKLITAISALSRSQVKRRIRNFKGRIKLDFTDAYLDSISTDKLRHILMAAITTLSRR